MFSEVGGPLVDQARHSASQQFRISARSRRSGSGVCMLGEGEGGVGGWGGEWLWGGKGVMCGEATEVTLDPHKKIKTLSALQW